MNKNRNPYPLFIGIFLVILIGAFSTADSLAYTNKEGITSWQLVQDDSTGSNLSGQQDAPLAPDNGPTVDFTTTAQSELENVTTMIVTAELSATTGVEVTVPYTLTGTATNTSDYTIAPNPLIIAVGQSSGDITVTVTNDEIYETDETVIVTMGAPTNATQGTVFVHTATITNDDPLPTVSFVPPTQDGAEDGSSLSVTVQLDRPSVDEVSVPYSVSGSSTATLTADYTITTGPATIPPGSTSDTITITPVDDSFYESTENVIIDMGTPTNANQGAVTTSTANIIDDEIPSKVSFSPVSQSVSEGSNPTITAQLDKTYIEDITVPYSVSLSSTATEVDDFTIDPSPVIIPAGESSASITVNTVADGLYENDEDIIVEMGTPINAVQGTNTTSTVTILDGDDPPVVNFSPVTQNGLEGTLPTMNIYAQLNTISGLDVTVPYSLSPSSTATENEDFTIDPGPVIIPAGDPNAEITITIIDDNLYENSEDVIIDMGTPTNATPGTSTTATATIDDNDPLIGLGDNYEVAHSQVLNKPAPGVLGNDPVASNVTVALEVSKDPDDGILTLNNDGSFTYTPTPGYVGGDTFEYKILNVSNESEPYPESPSVEVTINVFDANSPHVSWLKPVQNGMQYDVECEDITLEVDAFDDIEVDTVIISFFDYILDEWTIIKIFHSPPYIVTFSTCILNPGFNQIGAIAYDSSGNDSGYPAFIWIFRYAYMNYLPLVTK